jgi:hypothetical protein
METKLTLHGEILGVRYFSEIKCTYGDIPFQLPVHKI